MFIACFTAFLDMMRLANGLDAILAAILWTYINGNFTYSLKLEAGTLDAISQSHAYEALKTSPVKIIFIPFFYPTSLANLYIPPCAVSNPVWIYGNTNVAFSEAKIISQNNANSKPLPKAFPLIAAMVGFLFFPNA